MDGNINPPNPKQRYGDLKVPLGLIPSAAKIYTGLALAEGARKYGAYNWRDKAVEAMTYVHAADRHLCAWVDGEEIDPDSGKPHLGHAMACLAILADAIECGNLIDNRPLPAPTGELLQRWKKSPPPVDAPSPAGDTDGYPFTNHRTMAEVMAEESRGAAAARQAGPLTAPGDWWANYVPSKPAAVPCGCVDGCACECAYNFEMPAWVFCREDQPERFDEYLAAQEKKPCDCSIPGRCKIENGWNMAPGSFCCKAEEGRG